MPKELESLFSEKQRLNNSLSAIEDYQDAVRETVGGSFVDRRVKEYSGRLSQVIKDIQGIQNPKAANDETDE